jgi:CheY-like chemotaxis protein
MPTPARSMVFIDVDPSWERLALGAERIQVVAPDAGLTERLASLAPTGVVANLACQGVLDGLRTARTLGWRIPVRGCIANPAADSALPLGVVEATGRPSDTETVLAALAPYSTPGVRVLTVGTEVDGLIGLRYALTRHGMSVAMGWDARQAIDLLEVVRPHIVLLDATLPVRERFEVLARLGASDPTPTVVFLGADDDPAAGFAKQLRDCTAGRRVSARQLVFRVLHGLRGDAHSPASTACAAARPA